MADKAISSLDAITELSDDALLVAEQNGAAGKVTGAQWKAYAVAAAQGVNKGDDGITPHIGENGNWYIGETDTGVVAEGQNGDNGITPHIGANGHWYIGDTDTGVTAQGPAGSGTGDMLASVYDPNGKAQDIFAYVDTQIGDISSVLDSINGEVD